VSDAPVAITFDFWDTLVRAPDDREVLRRRQTRLAAVLQRAGASVDPDVLDEVLTGVRRTHAERWVVNEQFTGRDAARLLLDRLGLSVDAATVERTVDAICGYRPGDAPPLTDNVEAVLRELKARDVRVGIICDVALAPSTVLRTYLEHHGLLALFDHWSFSDEVGVYKPHPEIFQHALAGLGGVDAADAAHVGDLRRTDVAGARAVGMTAVRYAGANDDDAAAAGEGDRSIGPAVSTALSAADEAEADHVIADHSELLKVLGFD
jgi:FMN phosphatase YigB (HAD superfamily)